MTVEWEEPPAHVVGGKARTTKYAEFFQELRFRPGKWAKVPGGRTTHASAVTLAHDIRTGRKGGTQPNEFETAVDDLQVYARFIEEEDEL